MKNSINGNNVFQLFPAEPQKTRAKENFNPEGETPVTEVIPTQSGEYLEKVRTTIQAHLRAKIEKPPFLYLVKNPESDANAQEDSEIIPMGYRGNKVEPIDPMAPHSKWFKKN